MENKTLDELADEANHYAAQGDACFEQGLNFYFAAGRRLIEAKNRLPHGQWQQWLIDNFSSSADTAQNYMKLARRFGAKTETFRFLTPATLIKMLALPEGDEEEFIAAQAAAGRPVEKQSAREIQRNVKAFKQQRAVKKSADANLPTLQGLSLPFDAPNDSPPESPVTIVPETVDVLQDDRTDFPDEETDDTLAIVDCNVVSDTLPVVGSIPATINVSTNVAINLVDTPAQVAAVRELIVATTNSQQLRAIRI